MQALRSTLIRAGSALSNARPPGFCAVQGILGARAVSLGQISSSRSCNFRNILSTLSRTGGNNLHATFLASISMPIKRFSTTTVESSKQPMFAVIVVGGKQYKVCENDCIVTEKLIGKSVGDKVSMDQVLLIGTSTETKLGQPLVKNAYVEVVVEQQTLSDKLYIFKKRRRKNSRRLRGYRPSVSSLRITAIHAG